MSTTPTAQALQPKDPALNAVRALAILMVVTIHCTSAGLVLTPGVPNWWAALAWGSLVRPAVPLFFMCSGALMLCRDITPRRLLTHNLPRILCAMFAWAFLYRVFALLPGGLTLAELWDALKRTLLFQHEFHFYYLHILLLVYAFLPIVRVFVRSAAKKELEYALGVWFVTGILFPLLRTLWPFSLIAPISTRWVMSMAYSAIGYALLGHYLRQFGSAIPRRWYVLAWAAGLAVTAGGCAVTSLQGGALNELFLEGMSPGPMLMSAGIFGLLLSSKTWPKPVVQLTDRLARASFCIYLCHVFFLRVLQRVGFTSAVSPTILTIPASTLLVLAGSYLTWELLHRIPVVNRYLV